MSIEIEKVPLQLDIIWHKDFLLGNEYAQEIFKILNRNPDDISQHEIGIPVKFNCELKEIKYEYAKITGLIILIDNKLILDDDYQKKLKEFLRVNSNRTFLIPISFCDKINSIDLGIKKINIVQITEKSLGDILEELNTEYEKIKNEYFLNSVLQKISNELYKLDEESKKINLFLSHTKRDSIGKKNAVELKKIIQNCTKTDVFFDVNDIEIGSGFWDEIESEIKKKETFLIAINTNEYSNSSWCRKEILCAKKYKRPILVINAVTENQLRSFPYLGNTKVVILKENNEKINLYKILKDIYIEAIRVKYKEISMIKYKNKGEIFINSPEILDFALNPNLQKIIYYPDPPLPKEEIELFQIFEKKICTPLEAGLNVLSLKNKNIMLSISEAKNDVGYSFQIKSFISELIRYLIAFDLSILYGGTLKYEDVSLNLMKQLVNVIDFYKKTEEISAEKKIVNYLAYPLSVMSEDEEASYKDNIEFKKFNPFNLTKELAIKYLKEEKEDSKEVWSKSLKEMRNNIVGESDYLIVAGGKLEGFKGELPGILEEILIAIEKKKPIYIVGYYGGVSKEIINLLLGKKENTLLAKYKEKIKVFNEGIKILNNGLSEERNKNLFELENNIQIIELILEGMSKLNKI